MTGALEAADETDKPAYQFVIKFAGIECGLFFFMTVPVQTCKHTPSATQTCSITCS